MRNHSIALSGRARAAGDPKRRCPLARARRRSRDVVWRAISSDDGLAGWLAESATVDLRPGGHGVVRFAGGHERRPCAMAEVDDGTSIAFDWSPASRCPARETRVELRLEDAGDGSTRITVSETGFPTGRWTRRRPPCRRGLGLGGGADGAYRRAGRARRRGLASGGSRRRLRGAGRIRRDAASTGRSPAAAPTRPPTSRGSCRSAGRPCPSYLQAALAGRRARRIAAQRARDALPADARAARRGRRLDVRGRRALGCPARGPADAGRAPV